MQRGAVAPTPSQVLTASGPKFSRGTRAAKIRRMIQQHAQQGRHQDDARHPLTGQYRQQYFRINDLVVRNDDVRNSTQQWAEHSQMESTKRGRSFDNRPPRKRTDKERYIHSSRLIIPRWVPTASDHRRARGIDDVSEFVTRAERWRRILAVSPNRRVCIQQDRLSRLGQRVAQFASAGNYRQPQSAIRRCSLADGWAISSGTQRQPALRIPKMAAKASVDRPR